MTRIAIVVGSTRPGRRAPTIAQWVYARARARQDARFELIDLAEQNLPLLDEPVPPAAGDYRHQHTRSWADTVGSYDGFVFVTPEYNHSVPAALKNALDFVYAEWNNKAAGFVGYGGSGGIRAVEQLRLTMAELQVADVRSQVSLSFADLSSADGTSDDQQFQPGEHHDRALHAMLDQVVAWSRALSGLRVGA